MSERKGWVRRAAERIAAMDFSDLFCRERNRLVEAEGGMTAETNRKAAREVERQIGEVICEEMNSGDPPIISGDLTPEQRAKVRAMLAAQLPKQLVEAGKAIAAAMTGRGQQAEEIRPFPGPSVAEQRAQVCEDLCYGFAGAVPPSHLGGFVFEGPPMTAADMEKPRRMMAEAQGRIEVIGPATPTIQRVQRFRIMDAPDGCQYIVDICKQAEAEEWFRLEAEYWSTYDDGTDAEPPPLPSSMRVFNKDSLTFAFPEIKVES